MTDLEILESIKKVALNYGKDMAIKVEGVYRNETAHFKSGNFLKTFSPGMEATVTFMPYGWMSANKFWKDHPEYAPIGIYEQVENTSALMKSRGIRKFIQFANLDAGMMTCAEIIKCRGGDVGRWNSNKPDVMNEYRDYVSKIKTPFANSL